MKILRGGLQNFLDTQKGGTEKIRGGSKNFYTSKPEGGGGPKRLEPLAKGAAKIPSFEFQYLYSPPTPPPLSY